MKKIVKLTERDLANIIKKVVKEQEENGTTPQVSTDSNTNQKVDFRTIQDKRSKESFLRSLEIMTDRLKEPANYSTFRKNSTFFNDQLPEFKRQLEILFKEIEGENPSH